MSQGEASLAEMKRMTKDFSGVCPLRIINFQDELCLVFRDPMSIVDPSLNLINVDDQSRLFRALEEFGSLVEEKIVVASIANIHSIFPVMAVCKVREWEEYKYVGKLVTLLNTDKPRSDQTKLVVSKWFYEIELGYHTEMEIVVSQEDILEPFAEEYRPYVPISLAVFSMADAKGWVLVSCSEFRTTRDLTLQVSLPAGSFYVIPICGLPYFEQDPSKSYSDSFPYVEISLNGPVARPKFADTIKELFKRYDLNKDYYLKYSSMKHILEALDLNLSETEFNDLISKRFDKIKGGLSQKGFEEFIVMILSNRPLVGISRLSSSKGISEEAWLQRQAGQSAE